MESRAGFQAKTQANLFSTELPPRAAAMHGKSGHIGDDEDGDSLCTEESSVVTTAPSPHVMTLLKK